jgi:7-cyano-7-deazaguanine synthase
MEQGYETHTLTFDYGQRHRIEIEKAIEISGVMGAASNKVMKVDLRAFGGSALTDDISVPKADADQPVQPDIPVTYVPARNTVFLSLALAFAETLSTGDIFIGVNALDYSGYPDCRPEYIQAFENMANLATKEAVEGSVRVVIHSPLANMTKREIALEASRLGAPIHLTWSCYDPGDDDKPCGRCDSCRLRANGFMEAGFKDPADGD